LAKLEQLRRLRVKKFLSEGKSPVDINYLDQIAPETTPQTNISATTTTNATTTETTSAKSTNTTNATTTVTTNATTTTETTSAKSTNTTTISTKIKTKASSDSTNDTSYDNPRLYYYRAYESLDNLIEIRREWDKYLVTPGSGGGRIPQHFIAPPQAPEGSPWRNFVKKAKNTTTDETNGVVKDPTNT